MNKWVSALGLIAFTAGAHGEEQGSALKLTTGLDISTGRYGESSNTDILVVPLTLSYAQFPWKFTAGAAYFDVDGPGNVIVGIDGVETQSSPEQTQTAGFGDITLSGSWSADSLWNTNPYIDLTFKIKLPTADEDAGLGTGYTDFQGQVDLAYALGRLTPLATIGYKIPGDTDQNKQLLGSVGIDFNWQEKTSTGAFFDYRDASTSDTDARKEAMVYTSYRFSSRLTITGYWVTGFSDASPDQGAGLLISIR